MKQISNGVKNKKILLFLLAAFLILPVVASAGAAEPPTQLCLLLNTFTNTLVYVAGGLAVIFIVVAGILFLSSMGKPEQMGQARKAIIAIVIGIALLIIAGAMGPIINEIFGSTITLCTSGTAAP